MSDSNISFSQFSWLEKWSATSFYVQRHSLSETVMLLKEWRDEEEAAHELADSLEDVPVEFQASCGMESTGILKPNY